MACSLKKQFIPLEMVTPTCLSELCLVSGCTLAYVALCLFHPFKDTFSKGLSPLIRFSFRLLVDTPCVLEKKVEFVVAECHVLYISRGLVM